MIMRVGLFIVLSSFASMVLGASESNGKIMSLEKIFSDAHLEIVQTIEALPDDVRVKLQSQSYADRIADFGETWNPTDVLREDVPLVRHLFSGISGEIAAVVYQSGGYRGPMVFLLLMNRKTDWYCKYTIGSGFVLTSSIETISYLFRGPKNERPDCDLLSVS